MKSFVADIPEKIVFGAGCVDTVGKYAKPLGRRAAIIAGKGVRPEKTALLDKIRALLGGQGVESFVYAEINENPLIPVVDAGVEFARENSCDLVIGVGGGSSLDSAKIIAMVCASGGSVRDYVLDGNMPGKRRTKSKRAHDRHYDHGGHGQRSHTVGGGDRSGNGQKAGLRLVACDVPHRCHRGPGAYPLYAEKRYRQYGYRRIFPCL